MASVFQEFCRDCCDVMPVEILVKDETDAAAFIATVYGGVVRTPNGLVAIDNQTLDFSGHVPSEGAILAVVESDDDGVLSIHDGAMFGTPETPSTGDLPAPGPGKHPIRVVSLYESQTLLSNDDIRPVAVLPTDYDALEMGHQIDTAPADTPLNADKFGFFDVVDEVLKSITLENFKTLLKMYFDGFYTLIGHTHTATTRWEPLANGDPSDPQIVFDGTGNVIMIEVPI